MTCDWIGTSHGFDTFWHIYFSLYSFQTYDQRKLLLMRCIRAVQRNKPLMISAAFYCLSYQTALVRVELSDLMSNCLVRVHRDKFASGKFAKTTTTTAMVNCFFLPI